MTENLGGDLCCVIISANLIRPQNKKTGWRASKGTGRRELEAISDRTPSSRIYAVKASCREGPNTLKQVFSKIAVLHVRVEAGCGCNVQ